MAIPHVLAIDLGTTGPKVALASLDGDVAGHEFERTSLLLTDGGGAEQDPEDWWRAIVTAVRRLLDRQLVPISDIAAVAVTAQWSGTVAVDGDGKHLANALIWMDSRGARYVGQVTGGPFKLLGHDVRRWREFVSKAGGIPSHSGQDPTAHILFLKHERPDIYRAASKFLEPADYLNQRLTGRAVSSFDCIAAHLVTDNRDIGGVHYDDHLITVSGLERAKLPDLVPSATVIGTLTIDAAYQLGLDPATKVVNGSGDLHSAVVGSGALADYAGHLYIGTSSWLGCHVPWKRTDVLHNQASLLSALPGRYFVANWQDTAGACLTFLRDRVFFADDSLGTLAGVGTLAGDRVYEAFDRLAAEAAPGAGGTLFTPWMNGARNPVGDHSIRGGWHNLSLSTTRADMVRSVYEGVAYNSRWLLDGLEAFVKKPIRALNCIGGGARSVVWCQIHADILDREIRLVADPQQANVRGAAFIAAIALGHASAEQLAARVKIDAIFTPDRGTAAMHEVRFGEFRNLYKHTKGIHARLNGGRR